MSAELKVNTREKEIADYYISLGYEVIRRGWPDFVFIKGDDIQFVEVKRKNQLGIKPEQERVRNLLVSFGLNYKVAFGMENGTPNFREYLDLHIKHLHGKVRRKAIRIIGSFKRSHQPAGPQGQSDARL